jgi:hypothetical protein
MSNYSVKERGSDIASSALVILAMLVLAGPRLAFGATDPLVIQGIDLLSISAALLIAFCLLNIIRHARALQ